MSTPTEIMFVARIASKGRVAGCSPALRSASRWASCALIENDFEPFKNLRDVRSRFARCEFFDCAKADSALGQPALVGVAQTVTDVVFHQTTRARQFADGVEIAGERHPRVG